MINNRKAIENMFCNKVQSKLIINYQAITRRGEEDIQGQDLLWGGGSEVGQ